MFYYSLAINKIIGFDFHQCEIGFWMFLPFDIPLVEKKTIHRRSKTVGVIENKSQSQFYNQKYSLKT